MKMKVKVTATVLAVVLLVAGGVLIFRQESSHQLTPAEAEDVVVKKLRARLKDPAAVQAIRVIRNKTAVAGDIMVEVDFQSTDKDGQGAHGKFWVLYQNGAAVFSGYSSWYPEQESGNGDRAGLFKN